MEREREREGDSESEIQRDGERGGSKRERGGERDNMKRMGMALQSKFKEETFACLQGHSGGFATQRKRRSSTGVLKNAPSRPQRRIRHTAK